MASVRSTASDRSTTTNNKKRKRSSGAKSRARSPTLPNSAPAPSTTAAPFTAAAAGGGASEAATVDSEARRQLASLTKWQLCTQQNLSEIRAECMKVRRELEKVEQAADTAVGQVQDEAADFRDARSQAAAESKAAAAYVEGIQRDVEQAVAVTQSELQSVKKKLRALELSTQELRTQSIDEDVLMTQLATLQERSEAELNKHADATAALLTTKQQAVDALAQQLTLATTTSRQELADVTRTLTQLGTHVAALTDRVGKLERAQQTVDDRHAQQLRTEVAELTRRLERKQEDAEHRLEHKLSDWMHHREPQPHPQPQVSPFSSPPPQQPPPQQLALVTASHHHHPPPYAEPMEHPATTEALRRLGRDMHLIGDDLHRLTQHVNGRQRELHDGFSKKLGALAAEIFSALEFDARRNATEHTRLHATVEAVLRDVADLRDSVDRRVHDRVNFALLDLRDSMKRMDDNLRRVMATTRPPRSRSRSRSRSPPRRQSSEAYTYAGQNRPYETRRDWGGGANQHRRDDEYSFQPTGDFYQARSVPVPSYVGPAVPRSRSRSRSNPRLRSDRSTAARSSSSPPRNAHRLEASTPYEPAVVALTNSRGSSPDRPPAARCAVDTSQPEADPEPSSARATGDEAHEPPPPPAAAQELGPAPPQQQPPPPPAPPVPRPKRLRVAHEVIVIEDDETAADDAFVPPNRAPPDVVTEDDDARPQTIVIHESADSASDEDAVCVSPPPDRLRTLSDVRLGALLYFCYGGAPDLDVEWTRFFSTLGAGDCIELSRATSFLRQYPELHAFPIYLAQFTVQVLSVEAPGSGAQGLGLPDDTHAVTGAVTAQLVTTEFHKVLAAIRHTWAELLAAKLQKLGELHPQTAGSVQFAVNPVLVDASNGVGNKDGIDDSVTLANVHNAWQSRQSESLWLLLRQHRFGATLPAFSGDMAASPGVYVFLLMFDPVCVHRPSPQSASFRLTNWGRALVIQLWDRVLSKLPYLLFADCSWLEKQTDTSGTLPPLGFCYMLSAVLAWNSVSDRAVASSPTLYRDAVRLFLDCLRVDGVSVKWQARSESLTLDEATEIELVGVGTDLVVSLQLDGFFDAAHAILVHKSAAAKATAALPAAPPPESLIASSSSAAS